MLQVDTIADLIKTLWASYGLTGLSVGSVLFLLWRNNKKCETEDLKGQMRIEELEKRMNDQLIHQIEDNKKMTEEYVSIVKDNVQILLQLTNSINAMNETMKRLESKD